MMMMMMKNIVIVAELNGLNFKSGHTFEIFPLATFTLTSWTFIDMRK